MERVIRFLSSYGGEFTSEEACLAYEALCAQVDAVMAPLGKMPEGTDFSNGMRGYVQHDPAIARKVRGDLWAMMKLHGVYARDCVRPWDGAVYRTHCINESTGREYGQPYFVSHPEKVTGEAMQPQMQEQQA